MRTKCFEAIALSTQPRAHYFDFTEQGRDMQHCNTVSMPDHKMNYYILTAADECLLYCSNSP